MKKHIFYCFSFIVCFHLKAEIHLEAAPSAYAHDWIAYDAQGNEIAQGAFTSGTSSGSTGYVYATIPNDVDQIIVNSIGYRYDIGTPTVGLTSQTTIDQPLNDSTYTLKKDADQIIAELQA